MVLIINITFILASFYISRSVGWNFSKVNLPNDVFISRFAIWKNRVFLAAPRWSKWSNNSVTLLEAPWIDPEVLSLMNIPSPPATAYLSPELQSLGKDCTNLLSVTALDIDNRGRLWVLDSPEDMNCPAKIIIYNLHHNEEISRENLLGVPRKNLKCLTVDPVIGLWGHRGYIGDPGDESIIIFDTGLTGQRKWWKLHLKHGPTVPRVYTNDLTISRKNKRLYITGTNSLDLFSIDLDKLRHRDRLSVEYSDILWHGIKLGTSTGLLCDSKDGVQYFLVSEHASVRWDTKYNLKAENHLILLQSEHVLSITDYRMDSSKNVWAIINPLWYDNRCVDTTNKWNATNRIIKIPGFDSFY
ncbi:major royal jelly protein 1-like [Cotesia glomerata]|uniref:Bee-milk protein n=1 Tax=Cotesia glomerata TaxID=32391 RepID=A0AAV7IWZ2_COTGL|nr:major royal jelly protein 1-like [Cotesia glomerata]KAH0560533.1 hypothetical protein KQX54_005542 [Cotesia glomerata]